MSKNITLNKSSRLHQINNIYRAFAAAFIGLTLLIICPFFLKSAAQSTDNFGGGTGYIEICKQTSGAGLENKFFQFKVNGGAMIFTVPPGFCTPPIAVPAGTVIVEELLTGITNNNSTFEGGFRLLDVNLRGGTDGNPMIIEKNLAARTVTFNIQPSSPQFGTLVTFTNTYAAKAYVEICNHADGATGNANASFYSIDSAPEFSVAPGECSAPQLITIPSTFGAPPASRAIRVTQRSRQNFTLESVSTTPADRFVSLTPGKGITVSANCANSSDPVVAGCEYNNPGGGYATVQVVEGDLPAKTTVDFFNRYEAARNLKICKVAGPGVSIGTEFTFDIAVNGEPDAGVPSIPVTAGNASTGGNCVFSEGLNGSGSFPAGSVVTVTERNAAGFFVSEITSPGGGMPTVVLSERKATLTLAPGINTLTFTNASSTPVSVPTSTGTNISVEPIEELNLTFSNVTTAGNTTVTVFPPDQQPPLPSGFVVAGDGVAYEITTTAQFSGNITVTFDVPNVASLADCNALRILHYTNGAWDSTGNAAPQYNGETRVCTVSQTVTSLSPFVIAQNLAPTAAAVSVGGHVTTMKGRGIGNVTVSISDLNGIIRTTRSSTSGYYRFDNVAAGETYIITVQGKRLIFNPPVQVLNIVADTDNINFVEYNGRTSVSR